MVNKKRNNLRILFKGFVLKRALYSSPSLQPSALLCLKHLTSSAETSFDREWGIQLKIEKSFEFVQTVTTAKAQRLLLIFGLDVLQ